MLTSWAFAAGMAMSVVIQHFTCLGPLYSISTWIQLGLGERHHRIRLCNCCICNLRKCCLLFVPSAMQLDEELKTFSMDVDADCICS